MVVTVEGQQTNRGSLKQQVKAQERQKDTRARRTDATRWRPAKPPPPAEAAAVLAGGAIIGERVLERLRLRSRPRLGPSAVAPKLSERPKSRRRPPSPFSLFTSNPPSGALKERVKKLSPPSSSLSPLTGLPGTPSMSPSTSGTSSVLESGWCRVVLEFPLPR